jgi:allantoin racemase
LARDRRWTRTARGAAGPTEMSGKLRLLVVNPNTNVNITLGMVNRAQLVADECFKNVSIEVSGATVTEGENLITDEASLARSADSVVRLLSASDLSFYHGIIIAAFGDPALDRLNLPIPAVGIGESSIRQAKESGRRFVIVTTTPLLKASIERQVDAQDSTNIFGGVILTPGDPREVMQTAEGLEAALAECCRIAIDRHCAETIVIGGGPLGIAATALQKQFKSCLILDPVLCAVRSVVAKIVQARAVPSEEPPRSNL